MIEAVSDLAPSIRRLAERRVKQRAEQKRTWARENLKVYAEWVKTETEKLLNAEAEAEAEVAGWAEALSLLKRARIPVSTSPFNLDLEVETTQRKLVAVYRVVGRLDGANARKEVADAGKNLVRVTLRAVKFPCVRVTYLRTLKPTDTCRIEVVRSERAELVCGR